MLAVAQADSAASATTQLTRIRATSAVSAVAPPGMSGAAQLWTSLLREAQRKRPSRGQPLQRQHAPEDFTHDLVAAASDRPETRIPRGALDPVLAHVAGAAVDLQAGVHQLERC